MGRYSLNHTKFLAHEERHHLEALLYKHRGERDATIIALALATGARASELLAIRPHDLNDYDKTCFFKGTKGSNDRSIPLKDDLYKRLKRLAEESPGPEIFNISYSRLRQVWDQYRPVKKGFHCLRHSFAIELFKRTRDLQLVKIALGHQNIQNTLIYAAYVYSTDEMRRIIE